MNFLIIGGTRLMGPHLVRELHSKGHTVTVFHRGETNTELPDGVTELKGDRVRLNDHKDVLLKTEPEIVIDMICRSEAEAKDVVAMFEGKAKRLVMASSCDVYRNMELMLGADEAEPDESRITEDSPLRENLYLYRKYAENEDDWRYHYDKILVEEVLMDSDKLDGTILRFPMIYGPGDYQHRLFPYVKRMVDGRPAVILEEERLQTRWIRGYVENMASAIVTAALDKRAVNQIYNVGERVAQKEVDWVKAVSDAIGWIGEITGVPSNDLPEKLRTKVNFAHHLDVDCSKFFDHLKFREPVTFYEGLKRTVAWEKANPPEFKPDDYDYELEDEILAQRNPMG